MAGRRIARQRVVAARFGAALRKQVPR